MLGLLPALLLLAGDLVAAPRVYLNEIHYHPVEKAAFTTDGDPVLDLTQDVHEFVELYNAESTNVSLAGWRLTGDIDFDFPTNAVIAAGRYLVAASNPARLLAVTQYALNATNVQGPFQRQLSNRGGTVRLRDAQDNTVDSVSYSASFPWAIGADALGADDEWTGLISSNFQYRGRSLERVSLTWPANDPANWLASPAAGNPSPGRANAVTRAVPRPVVVAQTAYQDNTGSKIIRASQLVRIDCTFSATNVLSEVSLEYFLDDINLANETRLNVVMTPTGPPAQGRYTALLPGRPDRTIVRYRIRANRGNGVETVSPRADDPLAWHAWFVTPARTSTNRIYDCFISTRSLGILDTNIYLNGTTRTRITGSGPSGQPREAWNATEPAVFVYNGEVFDARARYHGSQYRRDPGNNSWKWVFPRYQKFDDREGIFISDNTDETVVCGVLCRAVGLPASYTRWVDFYLNAEARIVRMDQDEMDDGLSERFAAEWARANPGTPVEDVGEFYKAQGVFLFEEPTGPFGYGGYRGLSPLPPYWTENARYKWTFGLQMNGWKGHNPMIDFVHGLWAARGDTPAAPGPNVPAMRSFLSTHCDVESVLTYLAIATWFGIWDDFNHNHFLWRRANGKWAAIPWDFDAALGGLGQTAATIYGSEFGAPGIYGFPLSWVDANWLKDSFYKSFRDEYKRRLFILNNTLLAPTNITGMGFGSYRSYADARFASINSQLGLGSFLRPRQPTNLFPVAAQAVLPPAALQASPYSHGANPAPRHATTTWWIRSVNGTYAAPVFKATSASNLTSMPVPFESLMFGELYFWRCSYTDTNGHPSIDSAETPFIYGVNPNLASLISIDPGTQWRYNESGVSPPGQWKMPSFDDSAWPQGAALLGADTGPLPEPIRTPLSLGSKITFYFRKQFNFDGDPANTFLRLRQIVDDGVVLYLNGAEILRVGMANGNVTNSTLAVRSVANAVYEGPYLFFPTNLNVGANVLAAEVHRWSSTSVDIVFGLSLEASVPPAPGSIVLNEVMADNRSVVGNGGAFPDYIELYNNSDLPQSLNGLSLSDDITRPGRYILPADATIEPFGYLVIWCDDRTNAPGLHAGFALDNDGQTVALFTVNTNGFQLSDSVTFGLQAPDYSVARATDGAGAWELAFATPGVENIPAATAPPTGLKINEWMASDAGGPDWLELYNPASMPVALSGLSLTDDVTDPAKSPLAPLSFIGARGFRQFIADEDPQQSARHVNFKLSGNGEIIALYDEALQLIDSVFFTAQASGVSEGRLPDGTDTIVPFANSASPEDPNYLPLDNIVINEVLAHSDPDTRFEDAVEFLNLTGAPVDLSGWWLSDDKSNLRKFRLPSGSVVPAGGFLVLYEYQFNPDPPDPAGFAFSSARGDAVHLSTSYADGGLSGYRTTANFGPSAAGVSLGRFPTSQGVEFVALSARTFGADNPATVEQFRTGHGASNAPAKVGPVVISEVQYHPPDDPDGSDNTRDEFIELNNTSRAAVPLYDPAFPTNRWRLRDAVSFSFPPSTTLLPGETVLVVSFDPATNAAALAGFLDTYGALNVRLFGPYDGKLDNSSDSVELVQPDPPVTEPGPDLGFVPSILVDKVKYGDRHPWPDAADGTGSSLMRRLSTAYGNEPTNWFAWVPTPGDENLYNVLPTVSLTAPSDGAAFQGPTDIVLTAEASDLDGSVARVDYFDGAVKIGQATTPPYRFTWTNAPFGPHTLFARARDDRNAASLSAPVNIRVLSRPPSVVLTSPTNGAIYMTSNNVPLAATAADPDTPVTRVEFLVDGVKVGERLSAPYSAVWTAMAGPHELSAVALDSSGVSSTSSVVSVFVQAVAYSSTVAITSNSVWRYLDTGSNQGNGWTNLNLADGAWSSGPAELGYGDGAEGRPEATIINFGTDSANKYITYYFRQKFVVGSTSDVGSVTLRIMRDDGAIAYLNGAEVFRDNMPAGAVNYLTLAPNPISGAGEYTFITTNLGANRLVAGTNILAVEVHQQSAGSSDLSFAAELSIARAVIGPAIVTQPASRTNALGGMATFTVGAIGTPPLSYEWRFNGTPLTGQTNATLMLAGVQAAQAGIYTVQVTNRAGAVTSSPATLTIGEADSDGDGIPDAWELAHGLDPFDEFDAFEDPDTDGMDNRSEYVAGTDPNDAASLLRIDSVAFGRAAVLSFQAAPNTAYAVQYTDTLGAGPWHDLRVVAARSTARGETVADAAVGQSRFYRLAASGAPQTPFRIDGLGTARATLISFAAVSNKTYTVEYTDALGVGLWGKLADVPVQPSNRAVTVADPASATSRVYRVVTPASP